MGMKPRSTRRTRPNDELAVTPLSSPSTRLYNRRKRIASGSPQRKNSTSSGGTDRGGVTKPPPSLPPVENLRIDVGSPTPSVQIIPPPEFQGFDYRSECPTLMNLLEGSPGTIDYTNLASELSAILSHTMDFMKRAFGDLQYLETGDYPIVNLRHRPMPKYQLKVDTPLSPSSASEVVSRTAIIPKSLPDDSLDTWPPPHWPSRFWRWAHDELERPKEDTLREFRMTYLDILVDMKSARRKAAFSWRCKGRRRPLYLDIEESMGDIERRICVNDIEIRRDGVIITPSTSTQLTYWERPVATIEVMLFAFLKEYSRELRRSLKIECFPSSPVHSPKHNGFNGYSNGYADKKVKEEKTNGYHANGHVGNGHSNGHLSPLSPKSPRSCTSQQLNGTYEKGRNGILRSGRKRNGEINGKHAVKFEFNNNLCKPSPFSSLNGKCSTNGTSTVSPRVSQRKVKEEKRTTPCVESPTMSRRVSCTPSTSTSSQSTFPPVSKEVEEENAHALYLLSLVKDAEQDSAMTNIFSLVFQSRPPEAAPKATPRTRKNSTAKKNGRRNSKQTKVEEELVTYPLQADDEIDHDDIKAELEDAAEELRETDRECTAQLKAMEAKVCAEMAYDEAMKRLHRMEDELYTLYLRFYREVPRRQPNFAEIPLLAKALAGRRKAMKVMYGKRRLWRHPKLQPLHPAWLSAPYVEGAKHKRKPNAFDYTRDMKDLVLEDIDDFEDVRKKEESGDSDSETEGEEETGEMLRKRLEEENEEDEREYERELREGRERREEGIREGKGVLTRMKRSYEEGREEEEREESVQVVSSPTPPPVVFSPRLLRKIKQEPIYDW